jgi:N-hydroxyarylamine O-acetyltransferase
VPLAAHPCAASGVSVDRDSIQQYLRLLGVVRKKPSFDALSELVFAHLTRVPFENISKLYRLKRDGLAAPPTLRQFLDGIEQCHFGGTCYTNNFHFYTLLAALEYDVTLCSADMATPNVHMASIVRVEGHDYLVDTGYAAPFLSPVPLDLETDHLIHLGRDRYVLKPRDEFGQSCLELYRDGSLKHGYLLKPQPRTLEDFQAVIRDSFGPNATFLNSILLARFWHGSSVVIHNFTMIESWGREWSQRSLRPDEVATAIYNHFGIPSEIATAALGDLPDLQDAWGDPFLGGRSQTAKPCKPAV